MPARHTFFQKMLSNASHLPAAAGTDIPIHKIPLSCKKPSVRSDRGRKNAVPPLVLRFLTKTASCRANTRRRDNGRTRHGPTGGLPCSGGCSRVYFPACPLPLSPNRGLSGRDGGRYSSLSSQCHIDVDYRISFGFCQVESRRVIRHKSVSLFPRSSDSTKPNFCAVSCIPPRCPAAPRRRPGRRRRCARRR